MFVCDGSRRERHVSVVWSQAGRSFGEDRITYPCCTFAVAILSFVSVQSFMQLHGIPRLLSCMLRLVSFMSKLRCGKKQLLYSSKQRTGIGI